MTSQVMKYKDQIGSVEFDLDDDCLHGQLLHISDLVTFESDSIGGLKKEFEAAVDDYLQTCEQEGLEPNKPFKGSFNVRVGTDLHKKIAFKASELDVSINEVVIKALGEFLADSISSSDLLSDVRNHLKRYVYEYQSTFAERRYSNPHNMPAAELPILYAASKRRGSIFVSNPEHAYEH
jgi:predicted HicB family RNase H-like nuclease